MEGEEELSSIEGAARKLLVSTLVLDGGKNMYSIFPEDL